MAGLQQASSRTEGVPKGAPSVSPTISQAVKSVPTMIQPSYLAIREPDLDLQFFANRKTQTQEEEPRSTSSLLGFAGSSLSPSRYIRKVYI